MKQDNVIAEMPVYSPNDFKLLLFLDKNMVSMSQYWK